MIDIAIATVADLYEDGGGIPATLQFPRPEDVKDEVNKVSAGGLKPGQAVIVNSSFSSALPGFAVPAMKKTFGLTGVVKSVDKVKFLTKRQLNLNCSRILQFICFDTFLKSVLVWPFFHRLIIHKLAPFRVGNRTLISLT